MYKRPSASRPLTYTLSYQMPCVIGPAIFAADLQFLDDLGVDYPSTTTINGTRLICSDHGLDYLDFLADEPQAERHGIVNVATLYQWMGY